MHTHTNKTKHSRSTATTTLRLSELNFIHAWFDILHEVNWSPWIHEANIFLVPLILWEDLNLNLHTRHPVCAIKKILVETPTTQLLITTHFLNHGYPCQVKRPTSLSIVPAQQMPAKFEGSHTSSPLEGSSLSLIRGLEVVFDHHKGLNIKSQVRKKTKFQVSPWTSNPQFSREILQTLKRGCRGVSMPWFGGSSHYGRVWTDLIFPMESWCYYYISNKHFSKPLL